MRIAMTSNRGVGCGGPARRRTGRAVRGLLWCGTWATVGMIIATAGPAAAAAPEVVERVVAVVDDQPILLSELEAQLALAMQSLDVQPGDSARVQQLREELLEQQIDQRVIYLEAQQQGLPVDDQEIDQLVNDAIARNRDESGSEEAFQSQLRREGLTEEDLRARYREQARVELTVSRLIQREIRGQTDVTPEEVRAYYDQHRSELPQRESGIHLQRIVFQVKPDPALYDRAREQAVEVAGQIARGSVTFTDAARRWSDDPNGRTGGDLQRVARGDFADRLGAAFEDSLFALPTGVVSRPLLSPLGYHLVFVHEKDPAGAWVHASHILFGVPIVQADRARAETLADEIYQRLQAGGSFADLARQYSDDPMSRDKGGDLGWLPLSALGETIRAPIAALGVGETSRPISTSSEVQIFRVLGRESEREFEFDEIKDELTDLVRNTKMEGRYRAWVDGLKQKHYIERRAWDQP
jgi:peptidyl-prolyl cis-trans isomerase SurA